ncbi:galactose oxidase-like protein, partial [Dokdonella fugitiva]
MLVWGGELWNGAQYALTNTGHRYNPATGAWTAMATTNAPSLRTGASVIWAGDRMIVWGGYYFLGYLASGAQYFPGGADGAPGSWVPTTTVGVPYGRSKHAAVWASGGDADGKMLIWGGTNPFAENNRSLARVALFDPLAAEQGVWSETSFGVPPGDANQSFVWTGVELVGWGGSYNTGYAFDLAASSWRRLSNTGAPSARHDHGAIWTGTDVLVWGGVNGAVHFGDGARYSPFFDAWSAIAAAPIAARAGHSTVWAGDRAFIWGGEGDGGQLLGDGASYSPSLNSWTLISAATPAPSARKGHVAVWTGSRMVIQGGLSPNPTSSGGRYDPGANAWETTSLVGAPPASADRHVVWTGGKMLVCCFDQPAFSAKLYDPVADAWANATATGSPPGAVDAEAVVWSGTEMIVFADGANGGRYDPALDTWKAITSVGAPLYSKAAHWTGSSMLMGVPGAGGWLYYPSGENTPPVVDNQFFQVSESTPVGVSIGTVVATDDGLPTPAQLTYAITAGNVGGVFAINPATGALTIAHALDYETLSSYSLAVNVSDGMLSTAATVSIDVMDVIGGPGVENIAPQVPAGQVFAIAEDATAGTSLGTVQATDDGLPTPPALSYAITAGNTNGAFAIDPATGALTVAAALDYETQSSYALTIEVSDGALSGTGTVTVNVTDVIGGPGAENAAPQVVPGQVFVIAENASTGAAVGIVQAMDDGLPKSSALSYSITTLNSGFALNPTTGMLTIATVLDYETRSSYTLTIKVSDGQLSGTGTVTVNVTDVIGGPGVENIAPQVTAGQVFAIAEDAAASTAIGTVQATDDGLPTPALSYAITAGNTNGAFAIDPATGALTVAGALDYETQSSYVLTIEVSDGALSGTGTVTVNVTDVVGGPGVENIAPQVPAQVFTVAEDAAASTAIGTVQATDDGLPTPPALSYAITAGNTNGAFAIDPATGALTVAGALDYETQSSYGLTIEVSDGALSGTGTVTVNVTNVIEPGENVA